MPDYEEWMGPTYTRLVSDQQIQSERCVNWRLEPIPGKGKSKYALLRQPGLKVFCDTGLKAKVRALYSLDGYCYAVVGNHFLGINADGTFLDNSVKFGTYVQDDGLKAWIAVNSAITQIMIVGGGMAYICNPSIKPIVSGLPQGGVAACEMLDGFFIATFQNSVQFQLSNLNDGATWDATVISSKQSRPDYIQAPIYLRQEIWFFGQLTTQPYYDSGALNFPLAPNQSAIINAGLASPQALVRMGNNLFWLEVDENGHGVFCRNEGYDKVRISNSAIESVWNNYPLISDAFAWAYQENGHYCVRLTFPSAPSRNALGMPIPNTSGGATWEFDLLTGQWTETPYWNATLGREEQHRGFCSCVAFDKILVGDYENGIIYEMNSSFLDDNGAVIRRERRAPHLYSENKWIVYNHFELDGNKGIGLPVDNTQPYYNPAGVLTYSNDGGRSFSPTERTIRFGPAGNYGTRAFAAGLGSGRNRVHRFVVTDPVNWGIAAARLDYEVLGA